MSKKIVCVRIERGKEVVITGFYSQPDEHEPAEFEVENVFYEGVDITEIVNFLNGFDRLAERCIYVLEGGE